MNAITKLARTFHVGTSFALLLTAAIQAAGFVMIARGLGANEFGRLMIMQAFSQLSLELVSLGAGDALIRRVSRDRSHHRSAFGHALIMTALTGLPTSIVLALAAMAYDPAIAVAATALFLVGDLIGNRLVSLAEHAFVAQTRIWDANIVRLGSAVPRTIAAMYAFYLASRPAGLETWMIIQSTITLVAGLCAIAFVALRLGRPLLKFHRDDLSFGASMAITQWSLSLQFSMDRLVLGLAASPSLVAVYSAAMRCIQLALLPIVSVLRNIYAGFFTTGQHGITATSAYARANIYKILVLGSCAGVTLALGADFFAWVFGREFSETASILRWLAAVPLFRGIQLILADALSGADLHYIRTMLSLGGGVCYVALMAILVVAYGKVGLIVSVNLYYALIIISHVVIIMHFSKHKRPQTAT
jgi:O-antigen/teichoic acid export membrane protein